jgi:electron transport complex protein RnfE
MSEPAATAATATATPPATAPGPAPRLAPAARLLWHDNPAIVHLLGLCPLLAVTTTAVNGMLLGLATIVVLTGSAACISLLRHVIPEPVRLPAMVLVIAAWTTAATLLLQAYLFAMHGRVALFVQIIVTNCVILARCEQVARRHGVTASVVDGATAGAGFALALVAVGSLRELIGRHTLGSGLDLLFGPAAAGVHLVLPGDGFLLAVLPPGGFLLLGALAALHAATTRRRR